jgi:transposase
MTYSKDLKTKILKCIKLKEFSDTEIIRIFNINRMTFYRWKNQFKNNSSKNSHRKLKINNSIKNYIKKYVTAKVNFNYRKLIKNIETKYEITISKSIIYKVLKDDKIKKKKLYTKQILSKKEKLEEQKKTLKKQ